MVASDNVSRYFGVTLSPARAVEPLDASKVSDELATLILRSGVINESSGAPGRVHLLHINIGLLDEFEHGAIPFNERAERYTARLEVKKRFLRLLELKNYLLAWQYNEIYCGPNGEPDRQQRLCAIHSRGPEAIGYEFKNGLFPRCTRIRHFLLLWVSNDLWKISAEHKALRFVVHAHPTRPYHQVIGERGLKKYHSDYQVEIPSFGALTESSGG